MPLTLTGVLAMSASASQAHIPAVNRAFLLFLAVVLFTCAWLGINLAFPGLQATGIPSVVVRVIIHATLLVGLWLAIGRTGLDGTTRTTLWLAIAVPFTAWLAVVWGF